MEKPKSMSYIRILYKFNIQFYKCTGNKVKGPQIPHKEGEALKFI